MAIDAPILEKHLGTVVSTLLAGLAALANWAANAGAIRHMEGEISELKETVCANHRETMHGLERVHDKLDKHWGPR